MEKKYLLIGTQNSYYSKWKNVHQWIFWAIMELEVIQQIGKAAYYQPFDNISHLLYNSITTKAEETTFLIAQTLPASEYGV